MFKKLKQDSQSGFTIIEVMIVLAIAGVIMLVVFMAVPALQRSQRNTQRKNDVSSLLSAIQTAVDNNGGTLPATGYASLVSAGLDWNPSYYTTGNVTYTNNSTTLDVTDPMTGATTPLEKVFVETYAQCSSATAFNTNSATAGNTATSRSIAVVYSIEGGGGKAVEQCQNM